MSFLSKWWTGEDQDTSVAEVPKTPTVNQEEDDWIVVTDGPQGKGNRKTTLKINNKRFKSKRHGGPHSEDLLIEKALSVKGKGKAKSKSPEVKRKESSPETLEEEGITEGDLEIVMKQLEAKARDAQLHHTKVNKNRLDVSNRVQGMRNTNLTKTARHKGNPSTFGAHAHIPLRRGGAKQKGCSRRQL
eukprot:Nk52_evm60s270 gene=Nk52_evmTU60s270